MTFPLYRAPLGREDADATSGATCLTCGEPCAVRFGFSHVMHPCDACGKEMGFQGPGELVRCSYCDRLNEWPAEWPFDPGEDEGFGVCGPCLRAGRAAITHETELGIVSYPHAVLGVASGGDDHHDAVAARHGLETVTLEEFSDGSREIGIRLPDPGVLLELLRTPAHPSLQGEHWPFHCGRFETFLGNWRQSDFDRISPGHAREWFDAHLVRKADRENRDALWSWLPTGTGMSCVFQCQTCGAHSVFVDFD